MSAGFPKLTPGVCASFGGSKAALEVALLQHREMELQLFLRTRTNEAPGEQGSKPNARVNPELAQHHDTNGSITLLMASTIRRQSEIFTVTCLRPRGVSL